jgi:hypothetical protein
MLGFRNPRERTPDPYDANVTFDGRALNYSPAWSKSVRSSLPRSRRFMQYDTEARKTAIIVGPGSYEANTSAIGKSRIRGGPLYKPYHIGKRVDNNGYFMVGDQLVFDAHYIPTSARNSIKDLYCKIDQTSVLQTQDSFYKSRDTSREQPSRPQTSQGSRVNRTYISPADMEFDRSLRRVLEEAVTPEGKPERAKSRSGESRHVKSPYLSKFKS